MHIKTQIELTDNFSLTDLSECLSGAFNVQNNIDLVLNEMESISPNLVNGFRMFAIFGVKTNYFYYFFFQESLSIICQIEIHTRDNTLSFQLQHLYSMLKNIECRLKRKKFAKGKFLSLRVFDGNGNDTGLIISKTSKYQALKTGLLTPKYVEVIAITLAYYGFQIYKTQEFVKNLIPTLVIAVFVYFVQAIGKYFNEKNKVLIKGGSYE